MITQSEGQSPAQRGASIKWQLPKLLIAMLASRLLFVMLMPATYSTDLHSWLKVMDVLQAGGNPYRETGVLNWPPFWMQILFGLHQIAKHTGTSAIYIIQATLVCCEAVVMCIAYTIGQKFFNEKRLFSLILFGLALNPVAIFLSCQHCNYDVFVGLFVLLAAWMLIEWNQRSNPEAWLAACFFIGMGILAKTVPVILTPLLLLDIRRLQWPTRIFGLVLLAAPFTIGMSVLFTLEPHGVIEHVVGYRSLAGWYGITGLLFRAGWDGAMETYQRVSPVLFLALLVFSSIWCLKKTRLDAIQVLAIVLAMMMFIPNFGPGYSPPYILWYLPILTLLCAAADRNLRLLLVAGWLIAAFTYITEYALFNSHGAFMIQWNQSPSLMHLSEEAGSRKGQTLIRLPLFLWYLVLFAALLKLLRKPSKKSIAGVF